MKLLIDVGNTATKFATSGSEFNYVGRLYNSDISFTNIKSLLKGLSIKEIYVSSVNPKVAKKLDEIFLELFNIVPTYISVSFLKEDILKIDNKEELGADLLCDIVAAKESYGNKVAIIDLGTATKILFIDKDGYFSSCAIFLGYAKSKEILSNSTALLPSVGQIKVKPISSCHNTVDVINASAYYSQLDTINGIITRYEKEVGYSLKRVYTGGNLEDFKNDISYGDIDSTLSLKGIEILSRR